MSNTNVKLDTFNFRSLEDEKELIYAMYQSAISVFSLFDNINAYLIIDNKVKYISSKYFPIEVLNGVDVKPSELHLNTKEPYIMNDVEEFAKKAYGDTGLEILKNFGGIKVAVFIPMMFDSGVVGGIHMGFWKNSDKELNEELFNQIKLFQKTFIVFYQQAKVTGKIRSSQFQVLESFMTSLEYYDKYTKDHSKNVTALCMMMADHLNLNDSNRESLYYAATLHDIGKIYVTRNVLNKATKLTQEEYEEVKSHPEHGGDIVYNVLKSKEISDIVRYHHERWDGTGYPSGLKGENIPFLSRLITVCDSFDAMVSNRPYKKKLTYEEAIIELKTNASSQFDADIVELFIENIYHQ